MNILVSGPSPARGKGTWPYLLQERTNSELVNLAQAGAGNDYIYSSVMEELALRKYDLVIVMWSDFRRLDIKVSDINRFKATQYTSKHQRTLNDWPEKKIWPVNDQDYVDPNWVFGCGYINTGNTECQELADVFEHYYKHTDYNSHYLRGLTRMLGMQGFLKSMNIPYVFCFVREFKDLKTYSELYSLLDQDCMINDVTVHHYAGELNDWADPTHPGLDAHKLYVQDILVHLEKRKLI